MQNLAWLVHSKNVASVSMDLRRDRKLSLKLREAQNTPKLRGEETEKLAG